VRPIAAGRVQVGVADAARLDLDQDLVGLHLRNGDVLDHQRLAELVDNGRLHRLLRLCHDGSSFVENGDNYGPAGGGEGYPARTGRTYGPLGMTATLASGPYSASESARVDSTSRAGSTKQRARTSGATPSVTIFTRALRRTLASSSTCHWSFTK